MSGILASHLMDIPASSDSSFQYPPAMVIVGGQNKTSSNSVNINSGAGTNFTILAGSAIFVAIAFDSLSSTSPTITSVTDGFNTYTALTGITRSSATSIACQIFYTISSTKFETTFGSVPNQITVNFSTNITAKAMSVFAIPNCSTTFDLITASTSTSTTNRTITIPQLNIGDLILIATAIEDPFPAGGYSSPDQQNGNPSTTGYGKFDSLYATSGGNRTTNVSLLFVCRSVSIATTSATTSTALSWGGNSASNNVIIGAVIRHN